MQKLIDKQSYALHFLGIDAFKASRLQPTLGFNDREASLRQYSSPGCRRCFWSASGGLRKTRLLTGQRIISLTCRWSLRERRVCRWPACCREMRIQCGDISVLDIANAQWKLQQLGKLATHRPAARLQPRMSMRVRQQLQATAAARRLSLTTADDSASQSVGFSRAYRINLILALKARRTVYWRLSYLRRRNPGGACAAPRVSSRCYAPWVSQSRSNDVWC